MNKETQEICREIYTERVLDIILSSFRHVVDPTIKKRLLGLLQRVATHSAFRGQTTILLKVLKAIQGPVHSTQSIRPLDIILHKNLDACLCKYYCNYFLHAQL